MILLTYSLSALGNLLVGVLMSRTLFAVLSAEWKKALKYAAASVGVSVLVASGMGIAFGIFTSTIDGSNIPPEGKARLLGETISNGINCAAVGLPLGWVLGALLEWRRRVSARRSR